jgi:hypothetical protein
MNRDMLAMLPQAILAAVVVWGLLVVVLWGLG